MVKILFNLGLFIVVNTDLTETHWMSGKMYSYTVGVQVSMFSLVLSVMYIVWVNIHTQRSLRLILLQICKFAVSQLFS